MITINDARKIADEYCWKKFETDSSCTKFLEFVSNSVKQHAEFGHYSVVLTIPEYLSSVENPNFEKVVYCCRKIRYIGYGVRVSEGNIVVSW